MSEFLSYWETRQLLADKFNATQESMANEIAAWVWLRNLLAYQNVEVISGDGLVVGDRNRFFFDDKGRETQSFDYFPKLEGCYFKRADVEGFEPQDRYINGVALVQRWAVVCNGEDGARAKIRSCCRQRLTDYFPGYGGTQASADRWDYARWPPLDMALFSLRQVSAIEIEDFGDEVFPVESSVFMHQEIALTSSICEEILKSSDSQNGQTTCQANRGETLGQHQDNQTKSNKSDLNTESEILHQLSEKLNISFDEARKRFQEFSPRSYSSNTQIMKFKGFDSARFGNTAVEEPRHLTTDVEKIFSALGVSYDAPNEATKAKASPEDGQATGGVEAENRQGQIDEKLKFEDCFTLERKKMVWCAPVRQLALNFFQNHGRLPDFEVIWQNLYNHEPPEYKIEPVGRDTIKMSKQTIKRTELLRHWNNWTIPKPEKLEKKLEKSTKPKSNKSMQ